MICPTNSFGVRIEARMYGSRTSATLLGSGKSLGLWTGTTVPFVSVTSYSTLGIVASSSKSYSRSRALADDVHVQEAEEAAPEAEPERVAGLRLPAERGVVERQLLQRVAEVGG